MNTTLTDSSFYIDEHSLFNYDFKRRDNSLIDSLLDDMHVTNIMCNSISFDSYHYNFASNNTLIPHICNANST